MARLIRHDRNKPYVVDGGSGQKIAVCACGLSKNKPLCDGSHRRTAGEELDSLYLYDDSSRTKLVEHYP